MNRTLTTDLLVTAPTERNLEALPTEQLEALVIEIEKRKNAADTTDLVDEIRKVLARRYKTFVKNPDEEKVPRTPGTKVGFPKLPVLPPQPTSVGDVNLLMTDVPIVVAPYSEILIEVARQLIERTGGVMPEMDVEYVVSGMTQSPRMTVGWKVPRTLSAEELHSILQLLRLGYEQSVTGYKESGAGWEVTGSHASNTNKVSDSARQGIYIGPVATYSASAPGLFVYRKFKSRAEAELLRQNHPVNWLSKSITSTNKPMTFLQLRDPGKQIDKGDKTSLGLVQDNFLMLVVQISYLLRHRAFIEAAPLWVAIYRELNKVGTKTFDRDSLWGTQETLKVIERVMLLPYQRPELAAQLHIGSESVLLVGVPGVGKTSLEHYLMTSKNNVLFVAVDSDLLSVDLTKRGEDTPSVVLLRVDRIRRRTTLPVALIVDDIDAILDGKEVVSKFLNMLQGIRQKGLILLASTNHPEKIDPRLLEPGRLSKIVHVLLPCPEDRYGVLMTYLRHLPFSSHEEREKVARVLVEQTEGWSHRFLWELTQDASRYCLLGCTDDSPPILELRHFELAIPELERRLGFADLEGWEKRIEELIVNRKRYGF